MCTSKSAKQFSRGATSLSFTVKVSSSTTADGDNGGVVGYFVRMKISVLIPLSSSSQELAAEQVLVEIKHEHLVYGCL